MSCVVRFSIDEDGDQKEKKHRDGRLGERNEKEEATGADDIEERAGGRERRRRGWWWGSKGQRGEATAF